MNIVSFVDFVISRQRERTELHSLTLDKYGERWYTLSMKCREDIESQLKRTVLGSGLSRYRIAKMSGLSEAQLSYFVNGKRSLTLPAAAKLASALGLELRPKREK